MSDARMGGASSAGPWEEYWRRTREAAAHKGGGPQEEVLARFWSSFFANVLSSGSRQRLLDVACGNGAIARFALDAVNRNGSPAPSVFGIDNSLAAMTELGRRFPSVFGVISDARRTPFPDRSFDVVTSQFGLEYAGPEAVDEAARLVADGGVLAAILHLKDGAIFRENVTNLEAMNALRDSGILPATKELFRADLAVRTGKGSRPELRRADAALVAATTQVSGILQGMGEGVAGSVIHRLHGDIVHMHRRLGAHDSAEVTRWVDLMAGEGEAYRGRMSSMLSAAIDESDLEDMAQRAVSRGLTVRVRGTMLMGRSAQPAAWILVCDRR